MPAKRAQIVVQALGLLFTSVVAPVVVQVIARDLNLDETATHRGEQPPSQRKELPGQPTAPAVTKSPPAPAAQSPPQTTAAAIRPTPFPQVVVEGTGRNPEEALQQALRSALYQALATQCDAETWARRGQEVFEDVWHNGAGIIRSWKKLNAGKEWQLGGSIYHAKVTMEIDRQALVARLGAPSVHPAGDGEAANRNARGWACQLVK